MDEDTALDLLSIGFSDSPAAAPAATTNPAAPLQDSDVKKVAE